MSDKKVVTPHPAAPSNQIAVVEESKIQSLNPENLISQAIQKGLPVETMERLLAMRRELKAEYAKEQFDKDMAGFQGECPVIDKAKSARDESKGKTLYKYAPLDSIVEQTKALIQKYGFSYAFKTINTPERVSVTCIVKHKDGHAEESTMETNLATKTSIMSGPQQIASTVTFNKRYAFCNAFGIMTGDEDNDAQGADGAPDASAMIKQALAKANLKDANEFKEKLAKSKKYSPEQKIQYNQLADARIKELSEVK